MDAPPFISVIVLTCNRLAYLKDCVESLCAQAYPSDRMEIVVVDDGSDDGTDEWVERKRNTDERIVLIRHRENRGIPAARNSGLAAATGPIVAIVADDYLLKPDYLRTLADFFMARPDAMAVRFRIVPSDRRPASRISHFHYDVSFRKRLQPPSQTVDDVSWKSAWRKWPSWPTEITCLHNLEPAGAAAFRREVFDKVGFFDPELKRAEDIDMRSRFQQAGIPIYFNPHHVIPHRYGRFGWDTLKKSYESGKYARRLARKQAQPGPDPAPPARESLRHRLLLLLARIRQAGSPLDILIGVPGLIVFEAAWLLGYWKGGFSR